MARLLTLSEWMKNGSSAGDILGMLADAAGGGQISTSTGAGKLFSTRTYSGLDPSLISWYNSQAQGKTQSQVQEQAAKQSIAAGDAIRAGIANGTLAPSGETWDVYNATQAKNKTAQAEYDQRAAAMAGNPPAGNATDLGNGRQINIYNSSTGQYGYQSPGSPIPSGWQSVSGGGSATVNAGSVTSGGRTLDASSLSGSLQGISDNLAKLSAAGYGNVDLPDNFDLNGSDVVGSIKTYLQQKAAQGLVLNPNVNLSDPAVLKQFTDQATSEIHPYYASQLKLAMDNFLSGATDATGSLLRKENQEETQYGRDLRTLGENAADNGFAQSGIRNRQEGELANDTQYQINSDRASLASNVGQSARDFAQKYGTSNYTSPRIQAAPRVIAGQSSFDRSGSPSDIYTLSPDVYNGLIGSQQYQEKTDIASRASQIEQGQRQLQSNPYPLTT